MYSQETFELTPNAQIWPRRLNHLIGGEPSDIFLIVNDLGSSESGLNFINGYTFLERYYSIYDTERKQLGLARTPYTFATTN
jgi:cathepsin E